MSGLAVSLPWGATPGRIGGLVRWLTGAEPPADRAADAAGSRGTGQQPELRVVDGGLGPSRLSVSDLYHAHRLQLVRLAVLLVDDQPTAEDVVQDAFTGLYARWHRLEDPDKALAYLKASVVNLARSVLRRRRTARSYVPPHEPDVGSPESAAVLADEHRRVLVAMRELAPRQREVLVLRFWSGMAVAEIAEALAISVGAVKSTSSRALDALEKKLLEEQG